MTFSLFDVIVFALFFIWVIWTIAGNLLRRIGKLLYKKIQRLNLPRPPSSAQARDAGNRVPDRIWRQLLAPLDLVSCLQMEQSCKAFHRDGNIYFGQRRLVWNRNFLDQLYDVYNIHTVRANEELMLQTIAVKVGPWCRHVTLKVYRMLRDHSRFFSQFAQLESLYIKVETSSPELEQFIGNPSCLAYKTLVALRLNVVKTPNKELPATFPAFLSALPAVRYLEMWKGEAQFGTNLLSLKHELDEFSLFCDDNALPFFEKFAERFGPKLRGLYIRWQTKKLTAEKLQRFSQAFAKFSGLTHLELQFDWTTFGKQSSANKKLIEKLWSEFIQSGQQLLSHRLAKLSIDVQHNNFKSLIECATIVSNITRNMKHLNLLRLVISEPDVFPLAVKAEQVDALELNLRYLKTYKEVWMYISPKKVLPNPKDDYRYFFRKFEHADSVRALRLVNVPLLNKMLFKHLVKYFTCLEIFSVKAFSQTAYDKEFAENLSCFVDDLPKLRVIKLADAFRKPDLSNVIYKMAVRASQNQNAVYSVYVAGQVVNSGSCNILMPNFRVY